VSVYYSELLSNFREAIGELAGNRVAVLGHMRPDGDCIGSQVALTRVLSGMGIESVAVNRDPAPGNLRAFIGDTPFIKESEFEPEGWTAVAVDCADPVRIGRTLQAQFPDIILNIDHHISNPGYARHNLIHAQSSATAEILAGLFYDCEFPVDAVSAQALYVGIATDTGQFRFQSTTQQVFEICCRLMGDGADPATAAMDLYEQESIPKLKLLERFLASLRFECDGRVCVGILEDGVYASTGANKEDSEGLVDYARSIEGVDIGVLVEEHNGAIKGSFRSKEPIHRVDLLATQFNGGGHACAAGFNSFGKLQRFYPKLIASLREHFEKLKES
jgi:phosphoesterase RecJ-like protein